MALPVGHHVVAVAETLLAQVADEGTVAVLKGGSLARRGDGANARAGELDGAGRGAGPHGSAPATEFRFAEPSLPLFALLLGQHDPLLLLSHAFHLLVLLLGLVLLRVGNTVDRLEVLLDLGLVPVAGQAEATRQAVVLVVQNL